jgi:predicted ATPase
MEADMVEQDYGFDAAELYRDRLILITGCSGGGKSTLLAELARRGEQVFEEPGRQIVKEQDLIGGGALPWQDPAGFAELCLSRSMHNIALALASGRRAFFDRGLVDAYGFFEHLGLEAPAHFRNAVERLRYHADVFVLPPWPEIFATDAERRHDYDAALAAHTDLAATYSRLGYRLIEVPRTDPAARADFVLTHLGHQAA